MKISDSVYEKALSNAAPKLRRTLETSGLQGLERIIQKALVSALRDADFAVTEEVSLTELGGANLWESFHPRVDVLLPFPRTAHAIELKVVRMPNKAHLTASQRLYDIGQLTSDYWRIRAAKGITSGELGILLLGPLVPDLARPSLVSIEFHNRMYNDYVVSLSAGELRTQLRLRNQQGHQRRTQVKALKEIGWDKPVGAAPTDRRMFVHREFAYLVVPINKARHGV